MSTSMRVALVGDYQPGVPAHAAIPSALALAANDLGYFCEPEWLATDSLASDASSLPTLASFHGIWCVPGSPYVSMHGALSAITFARLHSIPFLGTCGGCQHALIEYARNVLGLEHADHAESNPTAGLPLIAPLSCPLVERADTVTLVAGTRLAQLYGKDEIHEHYHCRFGPALHYQDLFDNGTMRIAGLDHQGQARAFELTSHPWYTLTLFQPERSASTGVAHPLIRSFVQAMWEKSQSTFSVPLARGGQTPP
jgi:CTP synthase (UTP-ammonia lyase)